MLEMRTSERRDLKSCVQRWYWSQVEGLRPRRPATALWFGAAVHIALADWYIPGFKRGVHPVETFVKVLDGDRSMLVTNEDEEKVYIDARELGQDMLTRYVEHYGEEPHIEYIAPEFAGHVNLRRPERQVMGLKLPSTRIRYHLTYDGIKRNHDTGEIWIDEHKTAQSIWAEHLPLDEQAGAYWAIAGMRLRKAGILGKNEDVAGIEYNFLRKAKGDDRPIDNEGFRRNKPTKKEHYIDALIDHFGQDAPPEEMQSWQEDLPKMSLKGLQELAEVQKLEVWGDISANQPSPWFERYQVYRSRAERRSQIDRIFDESVFAEAYRGGLLPITKSPSIQTCRGCPYRTMCQLDEQGDQMAVEEFKEVLYTNVDPYEAYREKSED